MKESSRKSSSWKQHKKSILVPSRKSSLKNPSLKLQLFAKGSSRKASWKHHKKKSDRSSILKKNESWKYWKKKSANSKSSALSEIATWKHRKKKRSYITSSKSVLGLKSSSLKESVTWKRRKKHRSSQCLLYYIFHWNPGIASLHKTCEISFLFSLGHADVGSSKRIMNNGMNSLILFTIKCDVYCYVNVL